jgi:hypothetical protein
MKVIHMRPRTKSQRVVELGGLFRRYPK